MSFLKIQQDNMKYVGFWTENNKESIMKTLELRYKTGIIKGWHITDVVMNGDKVLIKWDRTFMPLPKR